MAEIAATGLVGDLKFETQLDAGDLGHGADQTTQLWTALSDEAAYADMSKAIIRCRRSLSANSDIADLLGSVEHRDGRLYYRIDKVAIERAAVMAPILDEWARVFRNDDALSEFDRAGFYLPMAIAGSWTARGQSYSMSYDTLQHTAAIFLSTPASSKTSLATGRCVNIIGERRQEREIAWRESLWNPICNGLILVGE